MSKIILVEKKVGDVMTHDVIAVDKTMMVSKVCSLMVKNKSRSVLVLSDGRFIGIVTASDIAFKVLFPGKDPNKTRVVDIMSSPLITVDYDTPVEKACKVMIKKNIRHLPVVKGGRIVGIVTPTDVLRGIEIVSVEE